MVELTGAFLEIAVVTDYDQAGESETLIGQTTDDVEIERDVSEIEYNIHGDPFTKRKEGFEAATATFSMIVTDTQQNMDDAEVIGADGRPLRNKEHEAVYIHAYPNAAASSPDATYEMLDAQFVMETINFPMEEAATAETAVWINGEHGFKQ